MGKSLWKLNGSSVKVEKALQAKKQQQQQQKKPEVTGPVKKEKKVITGQVLIYILAVEEKYNTHKVVKLIYYN